MNDSLYLILAALIGSLPGLLALWQSRRKNKAETNSIVAKAAGDLTDTAMALLNSLKERVGELERTVKEQDRTIERLTDKLDRSLKTIRALLRGMALLIHQLQEQGVTPAFVIPVDTEDLQEIEDKLLAAYGGA